LQHGIPRCTVRPTARIPHEVDELDAGGDGKSPLLAFVMLDNRHEIVIFRMFRPHFLPQGEDLRAEMFDELETRLVH
jgi:hypothetical protein